MHALRILVLIPGLLIVLLGGAIALTPARQYVPEIATRASETTSTMPPAAVTDINEVGQLQAAFNADAGTSRLVILLSPT